MPRSQLNFRCPPELKERFEQAAQRHRLTLTDWALTTLAAASEGRPIYQPADLKALQDATEQLRRAGIVTNQLVRLIHGYTVGAGRTMTLPEDRDWVEAAQLMQSAMDELRQRLGLT